MCNGKIRVLSVLMLLPFCAGEAQAKWSPAQGPLMTKWAKDVSPNKVLPEYPRPQMVRKQWQNLNGLWDYAVTSKNASAPAEFDGQILVPFPIESALSGVMKSVGEDKKLWYRCEFTIPEKLTHGRIKLNFGAVDFKTKVWVNGIKVGEHKGGYDSFSFDITDALIMEDLSGPWEGQELVVSVYDPVDAGTQPRGKQVREPEGIWYTSVTGIWQTVWLESVPEAYIESLKIIPDIDAGTVTVTVACSDGAEGHSIDIQVKDGWWSKAKAAGKPGKAIVIPIKDAKLWSPDSPFLYDLKITLKCSEGKKVDAVDSYFGMRKIALGKDKDGLTRIMFNNKFLFQIGFLDQGWWPDGLYTAPSDAALKYDIEVTKKLGMNMARKHVKVEPARWYYWCDKLGLIVWQDMPSGDKYIDPDEPDFQRSAESARQFETEYANLINNFYNHPSIVIWVPFNEGWGQYDTHGITKLTKKLDPTRLVISASGWTDRGTGDINDIHSYPGPEMPEPEEKRAIVLGEFGGLGLPVSGHTWQDQENWGYRNYEDQEELTAAYMDLIKKLYPMIAKGLSAAVYTQTTDVEGEVNGLMTYDRAVIKMKPADIVRINRGN
jgi:beta-galactosidase/beta-glucuronidase